MKENELTGIIVDCAFRVHTEIGPGLLESVYEIVLAHEIQSRGWAVERQVAIPIRYRGLVFEAGFRADLLVENTVIVELKSTEVNHPVHKKQLLTYLASRCRKIHRAKPDGVSLYYHSLVDHLAYRRVQQEP